MISIKSNVRHINSYKTDICTLHYTLVYVTNVIIIIIFKLLSFDFLFAEKYEKYYAQQCYSIASLFPCQNSLMSCNVELNVGYFRSNLCG